MRLLVLILEYSHSYSRVLRVLVRLPRVAIQVLAFSLASHSLARVTLPVNCTVQPLITRVHTRISCYIYIIHVCVLCYRSDSHVTAGLPRQCLYTSSSITLCGTHVLWYTDDWNADTIKLYMPLPSSNTLSCALVVLKSRETMLEVRSITTHGRCTSYIVRTVDVMHCSCTWSPYIVSNAFSTHPLKVNWGEPERAPRGHDVYCTCVRTCVRTCWRGLPGNE